MSESFTREELSKFGQLSHQLLLRDGDWGRITMTLIAARRLYSLAVLSTKRFADSEPDAMGPRFAEYTLEAMKLTADKGFNLHELEKHLREVCLPFVKDEESREDEQRRVEAARVRKLSRELWLRWPLKNKILRPGQILVLYGPPAEVDARLSALLLTELNNVFLGEGADALPMAKSTVTVLDHRQEYLAGDFRYIELPRWSLCCRTPQQWKSLLLSILREAGDPTNLLVLRNFHLTYSESSSGETSQYGRKFGNALRVICAGVESFAGFTVILGVYTQGSTHHVTAEMLTSRAERFPNLIFEEVK